MRVLIAALVLGCTMLITPLALADSPAVEDAAASDAPKDAAEERATQFVGVEGPDAESIPGGALLLAAYAVVWSLLFLFLMRMRGLQRQTAEELERLGAQVRTAKDG